MRIVRRDVFNITRSDVFRIIPLGDIHLGADACDEARLKKVVTRIAEEDDKTFWLGMGDYCDFINRTDPRFNPAALASWLTMADLADLAKAQRNRFLEIIQPIAPRCLALLEGNHETAITRHYERAIYSEIVSGVKDAAGWGGDYQLGLGYNGWLILAFYRNEQRQAGTIIKLNLHHGFVGGRLAGAKALNMQRWLWTHDCDCALFGHSHNTGVQVETIQSVTKGGQIIETPRFGAYTGTFLKSYSDRGSTYSEVKGYFPLPLAGIEILLQPGAENPRDRIRIVTCA